MTRIERLDPVVASQIAAGEVVERPASVVKELVENALDAGSGRIIVEVEDSGLSLIRVSDDGEGMTREDAVLSIERFATSKLKVIDDLHLVGTLGFRGEALPSIASCSRMTLLSRTEESPAAAMVQVEGGKVIGVSERGLPRGTTVEVRDLFYNTPARLKFIKTKTRERQAIIEVMERLALAWPEVRFELISQGKTILMTGGLGLLNTVADLYGPEIAGAVVSLEPAEERDSVRICGLLGLPRLYRRQRDRQFLSVNRRPVKTPWYAWALDESYRGLLPPKTYPVVFLNLEISPEDVDVNVHPTKAEVRFRNDAGVRRAVIHALSRALVSSELMGSATGETSRTLKPPAPMSTYQDLAPRPALSLPMVSEVRDKETDDWEYLGEIQCTYLVAKTRESLLIIDKHALMESITYLKLLSLPSASQDLLVAEIVRLSPGESTCYQDNEAYLEDLGFRSRLVGETTVMVTGVPLVLGQPLNPENLRDVLGSISQESLDGLSPKDVMAASKAALAACHASVRAGKPLKPQEARALIEDLYRTPSARVCPHGRPTVKEIPLKEIGDFFGRTSHVGPARV
ncbi:MAG: DNA mismatch repair endonuclease MutL [Bacillota bacterium]|jgi:DNA mismatch repair protein MutL